MILIIYLLGCIATAILFYYGLEKGDKVTVGELIIAILICVCSWISFFICLVIIFSDNIVFTKK